MFVLATIAENKTGTNLELLELTRTGKVGRDIRCTPELNLGAELVECPCARTRHQTAG